MRYLNVDRFIRGDDYYSENTVIEDTGKFINIIDGNKIKRVNKKDNNISFKLEEESGVIKMWLYFCDFIMYNYNRGELYDDYW